jgi:hypothetical protein
LIIKAAPGVEQAVLCKAPINLDKHRIEVARSERVQEVADLIVIGNVLHAQ